MLCAPSILPPIPNFVGIGDSLTEGTDGTSMQNQLVLLPYGSQYRQTNFGISGETLETMIADYNTRGHQFDTVITRTPWVMHVLGGNNDLTQGDSAQLIYDELLELWAMGTEDGAGVIAATITPSTGFNPTQEAIRLVVNAMILADPTKYWKVIDLANKPTFVDPTNLLYYLPDGTHFTALNQQIWAGFVNADLAP